MTKEKEIIEKRAPEKKNPERKGSEKKGMEKKEAIYESVWALYVSRRDFSQIRMGDVAENSGVPKGTIYEYFQSKDQLIAESILWACRREADALCRQVEEAEGFAAKWDRLLEWVRSSAGRSILILSFFSADEMPEGIKMELVRIGTEQCKKIDVPSRVMGTVIEAGRAEGILRTDGCIMARKTILYSIIAPLFLFDRFPAEFEGMSWEEVKVYSRKLLVAAFDKL